MRLPKAPPDSNIDAVPIERLRHIFRSVRPDVDNKYLHWDDLQRRKPPGDLKHHEWWLGLKFIRRGNLRTLPFQSTDGHPLTFILTEPLPELLHSFDKDCAGEIVLSDPLLNPQTRDRYIVSALMEEAVTSSQLEGASTTREVAQDMLRSGRAPKNKSERMIFNNFLAMQHLRDMAKNPLTPLIIFDLHRILTEGTLENNTAAGRFRTNAEKVRVMSDDDDILHVPPPANELEGRVEALCKFANDSNSSPFIHPLVRAMVLHFMLAYDHPFVDGNGRAARALFYWSALSRGYGLFEFLPLSRVILKGPVKYGRAFLLTETDDFDLTYFLLYHAKVIRTAVDDLKLYVRKKTEEVQQLDRVLQTHDGLNHRQRALLAHALRHLHHRYTFHSHQTSHNTSYQTARTDLLKLAEHELLSLRHEGKTFVFVPSEKLAAKLQGRG